MTTSPVWRQFKDCKTIADAVRVSHAIFQSVADDGFFRGEPLATAPRPIRRVDDLKGWKKKVLKWTRTLPAALLAHFKQIHTLTK